MKYFSAVLASLFFSIVPSVCFSDIGKIYQPYVEYLEKEIEVEYVHSHDNLNRHKESYTLAYGQAIAPHLFLEAGVMSIKDRDNRLRDEGYELELLWQLSEQGEYALDYAVLFEIEREVNENITETGAALVLEKEFRKTSLTLNIGLIYEFGSGIDNEYDRSLRAQWRYRYKPEFQPAIELQMDEYDKAFGPAARGLWRIGNRKKIKWSAAVLFGLDDETPSSLFRTAIEYEF